MVAHRILVPLVRVRVLLRQPQKEAASNKTQPPYYFHPHDSPKLLYPFRVNVKYQSRCPSSCFEPRDARHTHIAASPQTRGDVVPSRVTGRQVYDGCSAGTSPSLLPIHRLSDSLFSRKTKYLYPYCVRLSQSNTLLHSSICLHSFSWAKWEH